MSGREAGPPAGRSVRVELADAEQAEAARLDGCPVQGAVWLGRVELHGEPGALRVLAEALREAARLAEAGPGVDG